MSSGGYYDEGPKGPQSAVLSEDQVDQALREEFHNAQLEGKVAYNCRQKRTLGSVAIFCFCVNRMIGSGIFTSPAMVLNGAEKPGLALVWWAIGSILAISGVFVYTELGLTIPVYRSAAGPVAVPRSGGEKNYLEFIFNKPKLLMTCIYGVIFITLGNTAGNGIIAAENFIRTGNNYASKATVDNYNAKVKGIAVALIAGACVIHMLSRKAGLLLIQVLAWTKLACLWTLIILSFIARTKKNPFQSIPAGDDGRPPWTNLEPSKAFTEVGYAKFDGKGVVTEVLPDQNIGTRLSGVVGNLIALQSIIFSFGGFEQGNYILSEVRHPNKALPRGAFSAVITLAITYIFVNIAYFFVVPAEQINSLRPTFLIFFDQLFPDNKDAAEKAISAFVAICSFGNLVTVTFVSAKVKQEIAKEGILPPAKFWSADVDPWFMFRSRSRQGDGYDGTTTPIPALLLHFIFSAVFVVAPPVDLVYPLFVRTHSFVVQAIIGFMLAAGLLYMRWFYRSPIDDHDDKRYWKWSELRRNINGKTPWTSNKLIGTIFPLIYGLGMLFVIVASFFPVPDHSVLNKSPSPWFVYPAVGFGLIGIGVVYWFVLRFVMKWCWSRKLVTTRDIILLKDEMVQETVYARWYPTGGSRGTEDVTRHEDYQNRIGGNIRLQLRTNSAAAMYR